MPREFSLTCHLGSDPETVREHVMNPALFFHLASPLISARDIGERPIGGRWTEGEYRISMKIYGLLPIGWQVILVDLSGSGEGKGVLRDRGYGPLLRVWDHRILVSERSEGGTQYTDALRLDAGALTPILAFFVRQFFKHRQRRLIALDKAGFAPLANV